MITFSVDKMFAGKYNCENINKYSKKPLEVNDETVF